MSEEYYDDELVTSHSDENPELGEGGGGGSGTPSLICEGETSAVDDLYKKQRRLGVRADENVIYYEEFIPEVEHSTRDY